MGRGGGVIGVLSDDVVPVVCACSGHHSLLPEECILRQLRACFVGHNGISVFVILDLEP